MTILQDPSLTDVAPVLFARAGPKARLAPARTRVAAADPLTGSAAAHLAPGTGRKVAAQFSQIARFMF